MSDEKNLEQLRDRIREIDTQFASLLVERQKLASEVIDYKSVNSLPLRNYTVERRIIEHFKQQCQDHNLRESWGVELATLLIRCSIEMQNQMLSKQTSSGKHKVLLIGGNGKMGQWFVDYFESQGHQVKICDVVSIKAEKETDLESGLHWASLVLITAPLGETKDILEKVIQFKPKAVIAEICSLKNHLIATINKANEESLRITSLHPLFSPNVSTLHGRNIVVCPCGCPEADRMVTSLFAETAANVIELSLDDHDKYISATIALCHAVNIVFGFALRDAGIEYKQIRQVSSATLSKQIRTTIDVFRENANLFFEIQQYADHDHMYMLLERGLGSLAAMIDEGDQTAFLDKMAAVSRYFESLHDETNPC